MFHYVPLATFDQLFSLTFPGLQMNKKKCHCDCYVYMIFSQLFVLALTVVRFQLGPGALHIQYTYIIFLSTIV